MNRTLFVAALVGAGMVGGIAGPMIAGATTTYSQSERYQPASEPLRILDTRQPGHARLRAGVPITVDVPVIPNVAINENGAHEWETPALAVAVNLTVADPDADGYLTAWPAGFPQPEVSNVNFRAGEDESNFAIVPVSNGQIQVVSTVDADVIIDLFGQHDALIVPYVP